MVELGLREVNGLPLDSGVNDCRWNEGGLCVVLSKKKSMQHNCSFSQLGVWICSDYCPWQLIHRPTDVVMRET